MLSTATAVIIIAVAATDPPAQRRERFAETPDITLGDVDGDGRLDIAVANSGGRDGPVDVKSDEQS